MTNRTVVRTTWPPMNVLIVRSRESASVLCLCGEIDESFGADLVDGEAAVITTNDAESRLLQGLPATLSLLLQCGPWTTGCAIALPEAATQSGEIGASLLVASMTRLTWSVTSSTVLRRPALTPQPSPLPEWIEIVFRDWMTTASISSAIEATALEAGLRQIHDDLDGSHQAAQSIEGEGKHHGDYWHAIMHRREPDYANSQYWFRRVSRHPVFAPLTREAAAVAEQFHNAQLTQWLPRVMPGGVWNSLAFVDCVAAAATTEDDAFRRAVEEIQYREMLLLCAQTYRDAVGM